MVDSVPCPLMMVPSTWITRYWKWLLPSVVLGIIGCCALGSLASLLDVFRTVRGSAVYDQAWQQAHNHASIQIELGTPIMPGRLFSGQFNGNEASIVFNMNGPHGKGTVQSRGRRVNGIWTLIGLRVYARGINGEQQFIIIKPLDPTTTPLNNDANGP